MQVKLTKISFIVTLSKVQITQDSDSFSVWFRQVSLYLFCQPKIIQYNHTCK